MNLNWEYYEKREWLFEVYSKEFRSTTFTSSSECHRITDSHIGGSFHFRGFKVSMEFRAKCEEDLRSRKHMLTV